MRLIVLGEFVLRSSSGLRRWFVEPNIVGSNPTRSAKCGEIAISLRRPTLIVMTYR